MSDQSEVPPEQLLYEAVARWHAFLKERYGTIDALNTRWATEYWSQHYNNFDQVPLHATGILGPLAATSALPSDRASTSTGMASMRAAWLVSRTITGRNAQLRVIFGVGLLEVEKFVPPLLRLRFADRCQSEPQASWRELRGRCCTVCR